MNNGANNNQNKHSKIITSPVKEPLYETLSSLRFGKTDRTKNGFH